MVDTTENTSEISSCGEDGDEDVVIGDEEDSVPKVLLETSMRDDEGPINPSYPRGGHAKIGLERSADVIVIESESGL